MERLFLSPSTTSRYLKNIGETYFYMKFAFQSQKVVHRVFAKIDSNVYNSGIFVT